MAFTYNTVGVSGYSGYNGSSGYSGVSGWSGYAGTSLLVVTQSNSFTPGQAIYRTTGSYALAQANAVSSSDVIGIVQSATASGFNVVANGFISGLTNIGDSVGYYLSDTTAGLLVSAAPTATGSVVKPLMIGTGTTTGLVLDYPGALIGSINYGISGYTAKWTGAQSIGTGLIYDTGTAVGVNTLNPNNALTVVGNISATGNITVGSGIFNKGIVASLIFGG